MSMEPKKTVLIVEDEVNIVDIVRFNLQREGYTTLEAYDGEAGLALAREKKPDLILLDVMMPKMMGFDVCRALRAEGDNVPVIILTAREEEEDKILGLEIGADDYITKPFSMRELMARVKANIRRTAMVSGAAAESGMSAGGVLVVLHDVTQQRKAEERRREFVANVSHELRTPLTNIRSYAETIRDAGDELPRELENSFLDIVINESDRMTHIVQDLLTLSRLDSGRSEMNMARFDFGAAIDSVLRSIELEARRHGHELTHDYHDLPMIMGDRGRIEQVMLNVLGNAVKYTPDGGHIRVTAGTVGERVWMEVADDGIGIPKADRSRIFERFYRVDKARSRESGGTGLGLSIATEIVQRHNGTLSLVDREGPGTTVRLELPIRQSEVGGAQEGGNG